jgi:hypothetical protein
MHRKPFVFQEFAFENEEFGHFGFGTGLAREKQILLNTGIPIW